MGVLGLWSAAAQAMSPRNTGHDWGLQGDVGRLLCLPGVQQGGQCNSPHVARAEVAWGRCGTHQALTVHKPQLVIDKSQGDINHWAELQESGRDSE